MTAAVTCYLAKEMVPLVEKLNPQYDLPHKDYFSQIAFPSLYKETRQSL